MTSRPRAVLPRWVSLRCARPRALGSALSVVAALCLTLVVAGCGDQQRSTPGPDDGSDRRGLLYAIGRSPDPDQVPDIAERYGVVVLNAWDGDIAEQIKQRNPSAIVLVYQCLSSTRSFDSTQRRSGGVLYSEADPTWFATDTDGQRIEWNVYGSHWQMAVWDANYQQAWLDSVLATVDGGPWDGVLADNDLATLGYYSSALLAGTNSQAQTDEQLRDGLQALIDLAGPALQERGLSLVPNISDARLFPGRWAEHSRYGGGMEENFAHFGTDPNQGWVGDWGDDGWRAQTDHLSSDGLSLAITRAAATDRRSLLYGYASVLVRGDAEAFWAPSTEPGIARYREPEWIPELGWALGQADQAERSRDGVWTRRYAHGWVAVNPTDRGVRIQPPAGLVTGQGQPAAEQELPAYSGLLLRTED